MIVLAYCIVSSDDVTSSLGSADYSYRFVYERYIASLSQQCEVVSVTGEPGQIDIEYKRLRRLGLVSVCLYFAPPHKIQQGLCCPIIPVFAWEFNSLPSDDPGQTFLSWKSCLNYFGCAITHSEHTAEIISEGMSDGFPVSSVPAPVWDKFQPGAIKPIGFEENQFTLTSSGRIFDSARIDLERFASESWRESVDNLLSEPCDNTLVVNGIVYLSVLNPDDGRKNWTDFLKAFCWEFKYTSDVTLIIKVVQSSPEDFYRAFFRELYKLSDFACRIVVVDGYLEDTQFAELVYNSHYVVNSSHCEGQCLPLMEGMSAGKPAITPNHTGMAGYVTDENSFIVKSNLEPTFWPIDPRQKLRALRYRINWESLCTAFRDSYEVTVKQPDAYHLMSEKSVKALKEHCSEAIVRDNLLDFFSLIERHCYQKAFGRYIGLAYYFLAVRITGRIRSTIEKVS